jgi:predicted HTH transcriptional regulator
MLGRLSNRRGHSPIEIEAPHYELKQGIRRLEADKQVDTKMLDKIVEATCAIANNGPRRSGVLILGVADTEADKNRVEELYGISARAVGRKFVVGVRREAEVLGDSVEEYFRRIKTAIQNSELSDPLKAEVLASISFNDYYGMGLIVINVPTQSDASTVGEAIFVREGDPTVEVTGGSALLDIGGRFRS